MDNFEELDAMKAVASALNELNEEARKRVVNWVIDKFEINAQKINNTKNESDNVQEVTKDAQDSKEQNNYESVADLYYETSPKTDAEKALVVGYWFQFIKSQNEFDSQSVNNELKNLGHKIGNITRAFNQLMDKSPQLAIQTKKTGSTKQARKKLKLTRAGKKKIEEMIGNE